MTRAACHEWTAEDDAKIIAHTGLVRELAAELGYSMSMVYRRRQTLGLTKRRPKIYGEPLEKFIREKHSLGWTDIEIATAYGELHDWRVERHTIGDYRKRMKLPSNATSEHRRQQVAERTKQQLEEAGLMSLAELRVEAFRKFARSQGWPGDLRPRAVQMLNALYDFGAMTRRELAKEIGMPWKGSRKSLVSNDPEGSYLAHLMKRGFVISSRRSVTGKGRGTSVNLYSIPLTIKRGEPSTWPTANPN